MKTITKAQYRKLLNEQDTGSKHKHNRYHQRTRKYGDYLYFRTAIGLNSIMPNILVGYLVLTK